MSASNSRWTLADTSWALAFALVAFGLRAAFLFANEGAGWPHSLFYEGDAPVWIQWASALRAGQPFEFDLPVRAPGMAFLIEALGGDLRAPFTALKLTLCALGGATVGLFFAALRAWASPRVAGLAAALLALSFGQFELATSLNNEAPYLLLVVAALALHAWTRAGRSLSIALALGALHGLANLLRSEHVGFLALLLAFELLRARSNWRATIGRSALTALAFLVVSAPWMLRSHAALERFNELEPRPIAWERARPAWSPEARAALLELPAFCREGLFLMLSDRVGRAGSSRVEREDLARLLDSTFGYRPEPLALWTLSSAKGALDFALANDLTGDGGFSRAALSDEFDQDPPFAFGRPSHLKLWNHGYGIALERMRSDPAAWNALARAKLARFSDGLFTGFGSENWPLGLELSRAPIDLAVSRTRSYIWWSVCLVASFVGLVLGLRRRIAADWILWLGFKLALTVAFYGYARQGATAQLACFVLVALSLDALIALLPDHFLRWFVRPLVFVGLLASAGVVRELFDTRRFDVRGVDGARVVPAQQWGSGGFECQGALELAPAADGKMGER
ncbi:MAG: hypothetical protein ACKO4Q_06085 [Planctomycetota bacterium]